MKFLLQLKQKKNDDMGFLKYVSRKETQYDHSIPLGAHRAEHRYNASCRPSWGIGTHCFRRESAACASMSFAQYEKQ